jgi:hypothetical protein
VKVGRRSEQVTGTMAREAILLESAREEATDMIASNDRYLYVYGSTVGNWRSSRAGRLRMKSECPFVCHAEGSAYVTVKRQLADGIYADQASIIWICVACMVNGPEAFCLFLLRGEARSLSSEHDSYFCTIQRCGSGVDRGVIAGASPAHGVPRCLNKACRHTDVSIISLWGP